MHTSINCSLNRVRTGTLVLTHGAHSYVTFSLPNSVSFVVALYARDCRCNWIFSFSFLEFTRMGLASSKVSPSPLAYKGLEIQDGGRTTEEIFNTIVCSSSLSLNHGVSCDCRCGQTPAAVDELIHVVFGRAHNLLE